MKNILLSLLLLSLMNAYYRVFIGQNDYGNFTFGTDNQLQIGGVTGKLTIETEVENITNLDALHFNRLLYRAELEYSNMSYIHESSHLVDRRNANYNIKDYLQIKFRL